MNEQTYVLHLSGVTKDELGTLQRELGTIVSVEEDTHDGVLSPGVIEIATLLLVATGTTVSVAKDILEIVERWHKLRHEERELEQEIKVTLFAPDGTKIDLDKNVGGNRHS
jgi:hypothetical protein